MDHLAILSKQKKLLAKILSGDKTIETRWYESRRAPWGRIAQGDSIYFKETGDDVTVCARVAAVQEYQLTPQKVRALLEKHGKAIGIQKEQIDSWYRQIKDKKYCILVHIVDAHGIAPFAINKTGFGLMSAWISLPSISRLKKKKDLPTRPTVER